MKTTCFSGPLATELADFAATLEASATANKSLLTLLRALDRLTEERQLPSSIIDEAFASAWLAPCDSRGPNTRVARYHLLRRVCRFLAKRRPGTFIPGESLRPRRRPTALPHIYSREEVRLLLDGALTLPDWERWHPCPIRSKTIHAIILLLATAGLRISEALHLTLQDADLEQGVLSIRQSKFRKSRLVPLSTGTADVLRGYRELRDAVAPTGRDEAFFVSGRGKAYSPGYVGLMFRDIAVHRFFAYIAYAEPQHAELCRRVLDIPLKKTTSSIMTYLDRDEMKALLAMPRPSNRLGARDLALLTFLYNTGARASEAVGLTIKDIRFETPAQVRILGKGRKERACPLWPETVETLRAYLKQRDGVNEPGAPLFLNAHGRCLGRFGVVTIIKRYIAAAAKQQPSLAAKRISPHTLRHTAAMHLLQSGVELNVIKSWLGHVSITTTSQYIEIDMAMKREAIERCTPPVPDPSGDSPWRSRQDIIEWLEDL